MGLFDELMKTVGGTILGGSGQGGVLEQVLSVVNNPETGGLSGLVETFKSKGLGDAVSSWIGTGENQPVSGEAIANALGSDKIQQIAGTLGISAPEASNSLAALLPQVIDRLTPEGAVPEGDLLGKGLSLLKEKFLS
jgi:uncharacterized protein YidB (DUF937 family)